MKYGTCCRAAAAFRQLPLGGSEASLLHQVVKLRHGITGGQSGMIAIFGDTTLSERGDILGVYLVKFLMPRVIAVSFSYVSSEADDVFVQ